MTTSTTSDYFFVTAVSTSMWRHVLGYCQSQPVGDGSLSSYLFEAEACLTLHVKPFSEDWASPHPLPHGTFFSERYHQHTLFDIVQAVRKRELDSKVLTYPELLEGRDTMVVYFWPDEQDHSLEEIEGHPYLMSLNQKVHELFESLMRQSIRHL
ncbi:MAG: hypothetical protein NPIRA01_30450 [Nitrospirales bacterium]|nr:MAG: hypothetical protein NPIRA01_30450 [Nitrospirales bacterium]